MESVVLVIHLFLALAIIGLVLLQRSEGGGLGIGGGGGMGRLTTAKGAANILTRATGICAMAFFATSLILGILAGQSSKGRQGILDSLEQPVVEAPAQSKKTEETPAAADKEKPPDVPAAPISE
jgi:preprotein translocase subunit SecG